MIKAIYYMTILNNESQKSRLIFDNTEVLGPKDFTDCIFDRI